MYFSWFNFYRCLFYPQPRIISGLQPNCHQAHKTNWVAWKRHCPSWDLHAFMSTPSPAGKPFPPAACYKPGVSHRRRLELFTLLQTQNGDCEQWSMHSGSWFEICLINSGSQNASNNHRSFILLAWEVAKEIEKTALFKDDDFGCAEPACDRDSTSSGVIHSRTCSLCSDAGKWPWLAIAKTSAQKNIDFVGLSLKKKIMQKLKIQTVICKWVFI